MTAVAAIVASMIGTTACGGDAGDGAVRSYELPLRTDDSADEYSYIAEEPFDLRVGDEVTFRVHNAGSLNHDLQVVDPHGLAVATAPAVAPGGTLTLTVLFDEAGIYRLDCLVDDHLTAHKMQVFVEVTEPDA